MLKRIGFQNIIFDPNLPNIGIYSFDIWNHNTEIDILEQQASPVFQYGSQSDQTIDVVPTN